jgi:hypothetical protein
LLVVKDVEDVTYEAIKAKIAEVETAENLMPGQILCFPGKEKTLRLTG